MRRLMTGLAGLLLTLLLAACNPAVQPPPATDSQAQAKADLEASRAASCETGKEPWRSPGPPVRGGIMARATTSDFEHLDWLKPNSAGGQGIAQVYNTLLLLRGCDYEDNALVPGLAASWEISPDGLTYTMHLRDNVKWHNKPPVNGRKFTADDVGYTIDLQRKEGLIGSFWADVTYEVVDPYTILFKKRAPDADFLDKVGEYRNVIVPHEVKEQYGDFRTVAIGTGAFMVKDFKPGVFITTERNPDYYEDGIDGKPLPYLDGTQVTVFADYTAELAALRSGQLDTVRFSGVKKSDADVLRKTHPSLRYYTQERSSNSSIWFNLRKAPWNDYRVRKAVQLALDRDDLIASYQGAAAHAGFLPPAFKDYLWPVEKLQEAFKPDVERAKQLLTEAGYPPGSINVTMMTGSPYAQGAEVAQAQLRTIGIETRLQVYGDSFSPVLQREGLLQDIGWGNLGSVLFVSYWMSDIVRTGSSQNYIAFSDPEVDRLADAQARELDPAKRKALVDQEQQRLYDVMPFVPAVSEQYHRFESCRLRNAPKVSPSYNPRTVVFAWLDATGC